MSDIDWEAVVKEVMQEADPDIAKELDPETANASEDADEFLANLVAAAKRAAHVE